MDVRAAVKNQEKIFNILKQAKQNNRLSHAYLFYGDEGVGKKEMAYALACLLYCPNDGCLECEVCNSIISNNHMNVDYIGIDKSKTMISKDQITELQEEFSKTSLVEGSRIYIVDGIDTASSAAQNSLLKFIEEPINSTPTIGIFLAKEQANVVPTIISRCGLIHFKAIPLENAKFELMNKGLDELDSLLSASLTNNIDEAYKLAKEDEFIKLKEVFFEFLSLTTQKEAVIFTINNSSFLSTNKNIDVFLKWLILFLQDANRSLTSNDNLILIPIYDKIIKYTKKYKNGLSKRLEVVLNLYDKLRYNISAKNVLHELIVNMI